LIDVCIYIVCRVDRVDANWTFPLLVAEGKNVEVTILDEKYGNQQRQIDKQIIHSN
jgi:hypothetical protein